MLILCWVPRWWHCIVCLVCTVSQGPPLWRWRSPCLYFLVSRFEGGWGTAFCSESTSDDPPSPGSLFSFLNFEFMICELERGNIDYLGCMLGSAVVILFFVPHVCHVQKGRCWRSPWFLDFNFEIWGRVRNCFRSRKQFLRPPLPRVFI